MFEHHQHLELLQKLKKSDCSKLISKDLCFCSTLDLKDWYRGNVTCIWQISPGDLTCFYYRSKDSHRTYPTIFILALAARKLSYSLCSTEVATLDLDIVGMMFCPSPLHWLALILLCGFFLMVFRFYCIWVFYVKPGIFWKETGCPCWTDECPPSLLSGDSSTPCPWAFSLLEVSVHFLRCLQGMPSTPLTVLSAF